MLNLLRLAIPPILSLILLSNVSAQDDVSALIEELKTTLQAPAQTCSRDTDWQSIADLQYQLTNIDAQTQQLFTTVHEIYKHFLFMDILKHLAYWITRTDYLMSWDELFSNTEKQRTRKNIIYINEVGVIDRQPIVNVIGDLYEDDTLGFYQVTPIDEGDESQKPLGKYTLEWRDKSGQLLHKLSFHIFKASPYINEAGKKVFPFSVAIKEPENAYQLRMVTEGKELFSVNRSPNKPQVKFNKVQSISEQETLVSISVSDKDGDKCRIHLFYLQYSDGLKYNISHPLGIQGIGDYEFRFDPTTRFPASKTGILQARACDGLNCTNAYVPFTKVTNKPPQLFLSRKEKVYSSLKKLLKKRYEKQIRHKFNGEMPQKYVEALRQYAFEHYLYEVGAYDMEDNEIGDQVRWYDGEGVLVGKGDIFTTKEIIKGLTAKVKDSHGVEIELKVEE